jgi:hypothetical protein
VDTPPTTCGLSSMDSTGKGHVIARVYRSVDGTIPAGGRASFETEVPSAPLYRVHVDHAEVPQAP